MQISIIIPIYKVKKYIERCIQSVIAQTFTDYEVILVDDASPDNALQIAEKLLIENTIAFQTVKHEENQGLAAVRNSGIKAAKGNYIMFVDSDDAFANTKVLANFAATISHTDYDFVAANHHEVYSEKDHRTTNYTGKIEKSRSLENTAILKSFMTTEIPVTAWNKLLRKDFVLKHKLFFREGLIYEDELWTLELCMVAKHCYLLAAITYNYEQTNTTAITKNISKKAVADLFFIIGEILKKIEDNTDFITRNSAVVVAYYLAKNSTLLKRAISLEDKELWIFYYKKLRTIYTHSSLRKYKKSFLFSAHAAYRISSGIQQLKPNTVLKQFWKNVLLTLEMYNIRGGKVVIKEIVRKIC